MPLFDNSMADCEHSEDQRGAANSTGSCAYAAISLT